MAVLGVGGPPTRGAVVEGGASGLGSGGTSLAPRDKLLDDTQHSTFW